MPTPQQIMTKYALAAQEDSRTTAQAKTRLRSLYRQHRPASQRAALRAYLEDFALASILRETARRVRETFVAAPPVAVPETSTQTTQVRLNASNRAHAMRARLAAGNYEIAVHSHRWYDWPLKGGEKLGDQTRASLTAYLNIENKAIASRARAITFLRAVRDVLPNDNQRVRNVLSEVQLQQIHGATMTTAVTA